MSQKRAWKQTAADKGIWLWLAIWLLASYMLYQKWKDEEPPWPLGVLMPF
jgi:hypothetical protein